MEKPVISVCCPTHNARYLLELAQSLREQTFGRFEFVVLANGSVTDAEIEAKTSPIAAKTRIIRAPEGTPPNVGAVKKLAFDAATCALIIEVDHDDKLAPDCLERIWKEWQKTDADFLYSDMAVIEGDDMSDRGAVSWPSVCQPQLYEATVGGVKRTACRVVPLSPHFFFACSMAGPCHVRAWKKSFYEKVGGHRSDFTISDDYELITRCYIEGAKFHHVEECLYLYRVFPENTSHTRDKGKEESRTEFASYYKPMVPPVLRRWAKEKGLLGAETESAFVDAKPETYGYILADDSWSIVAEQEKFLQCAHELLVPGGWLVGSSKSWSRDTLLRYTRPSAKPPERKWQELGIWAEFRRKENAPVQLGDFDALHAILIKKGAEPLPGRDYWAMKADVWVERYFRPMFREASASVFRRGDRMEVYGGSLAAKLVEGLAEDYPGVFKYCGPPRASLVPEESMSKKDRSLEQVIEATPVVDYVVILWDKSGRAVEMQIKTWGLETLVAHLMILAPRRSYGRFVILDAEKTRILFEFDLDRFDINLGKTLPVPLVTAVQAHHNKARGR